MNETEEKPAKGYRSKLPNELRMYRDGVLVYSAPITLEPDYRPWCPHHEDEAECRLADPMADKAATCDLCDGPCKCDARALVGSPSTAFVRVDACLDGLRDHLHQCYAEARRASVNGHSRGVELRRRLGALEQGADMMRTANVIIVNRLDTLEAEQKRQADDGEDDEPLACEVCTRVSPRRWLIPVCEECARTAGVLPPLPNEDKTAVGASAMSHNGLKPDPAQSCEGCWSWHSPDEHCDRCQDYSAFTIAPAPPDRPPPGASAMSGKFSGWVPCDACGKEGNPVAMIVRQGARLCKACLSPEPPEPKPRKFALADESLPPVAPGSEAFQEGEGWVTFYFPSGRYINLVHEGRGCYTPSRDTRRHIAAVAIVEWHEWFMSQGDLPRVEHLMNDSVMNQAHAKWRAWRNQ